jgi:hypothetical protein
VVRVLRRIADEGGLGVAGGVRVPVHHEVLAKRAIESRRLPNRTYVLVGARGDKPPRPTLTSRADCRSRSH